MVTMVNDDQFTPDVIADPYTYFGHRRQEDPVHWNTKYGARIVTRYDDIVWLLRHPELFSSQCSNVTRDRRIRPFRRRIWSCTALCGSSLATFSSSMTAPSTPRCAGWRTATSPRVPGKLAPDGTHRHQGSPR